MVSHGVIVVVTPFNKLRSGIQIYFPYRSGSVASEGPCRDFYRLSRPARFGNSSSITRDNPLFFHFNGLWNMIQASYKLRS